MVSSDLTQGKRRATFVPRISSATSQRGLPMKHRIDPDGARLPIKLDTTSNGEFLPVPLSDFNRAANRLAHDEADRNAKRLAIPRREFLNLLDWNGGSRL